MNYLEVQINKMLIANIAYSNYVTVGFTYVRLSEARYKNVGEKFPKTRSRN